MSENNAPLESLAQKRNGLELTPEEDAVLASLITGQGSESDVAGFGKLPEARVRGFNIGMPPSKSWSISGDADDRPTEEVAFYYNKIAFE